MFSIISRDNGVQYLRVDAGVFGGGQHRHPQFGAGGCVLGYGGRVPGLGKYGGIVVDVQHPDADVGRGFEAGGTLEGGGSGVLEEEVLDRVRVGAC